MRNISSSLFLIILVFLQTVKSTTKDKPFDESQCHIYSEGPLCVANAEKMYLPPARPDGLIIHYNFEEDKLLNKASKTFPECKKPLKYTATFGGLGTAALINDNYCESTPNLDLEHDFTISFFLNLIENEAEKYQILYRGNLEDKKGHFEINFDQVSKQIEIGFSAKKDDNSSPMKLKSLGKLQLKKWYHIAIVKNYEEIVLYINGIKNNQIDLKDLTLNNIDAPIYLGNTNKAAKDVNYFIIDEFKVYQKELEKDFIQAEAGIILGGNTPSYYEIGCTDCTIQSANKSCDEFEGYRLCSNIEIYSGGINIVKDLGLLQQEQKIWTSSMDEADEEYAEKLGAGLCCAILK